jgi:hypothetical protein
MTCSPGACGKTTKQSEFGKGHARAKREQPPAGLACKGNADEIKRYYADARIPTLEVALIEHMNADDLKRLAKHINQKIPTRKADIAAVIKRHLDGERLISVWQDLDDLQRAAVAEVVHSSSSHFLADRFAAKYGRSPDWGSTDKYGYRLSPSPLGFFLSGGVMPDDL